MPAMPPVDPAFAEETDYSDPARRGCVLAVDLPPETLDRLRDLIPEVDFAVSFADMTPRLLATTRPDVILAPLVGAAFDILDLVRRLARCGFGGALQAVTGPVPDPEAIRAELLPHAGGMSIAILMLPASRACRAPR